MITQFGKFCRKLRIDRDELLRDMADILGVTSSYLSAVENGKRNVPKKWVPILTDVYGLDNAQQQELIQAIEASEIEKELRIDLSGYNNEDSRMLKALARKFSDFDDETKAQLMDILNSSD